MGALHVSKVVHGHQGWRLINCIWLHGGVFHLLVNMLSLVCIGILLEQVFGFGMYQSPGFILFRDRCAQLITAFQICLRSSWYHDLMFMQTID